MKVSIENYKSIQSGAFQGFFNLVLVSCGGLKIFGCKHFKNDKGDWFKLPQREVETEDGESEYYPHMTFLDKEYFEELKSAVYDALQEVNNGKSPQAKSAKSPLSSDTPPDWF